MRDPCYTPGPVKEVAPWQKRFVKFAKASTNLPSDSLTLHTAAMAREDCTVHQDHLAAASG